MRGSVWRKIKKTVMLSCKQWIHVCFNMRCQAEFTMISLHSVCQVIVNNKIAFAQIRHSSHYLKIEAGRWSRILMIQKIRLWFGLKYMFSLQWSNSCSAFQPISLDENNAMLYRFISSGPPCIITQFRLHLDTLGVISSAATLFK